MMIDAILIPLAGRRFASEIIAKIIAIMARGTAKGAIADVSIASIAKTSAQTPSAFDPGCTGAGCTIVGVG